MTQDEKIIALEKEIDELKTRAKSNDGMIAAFLGMVLQKNGMAGVARVPLHAETPEADREWAEHITAQIDAGARIWKDESGKH